MQAKNLAVIGVCATADKKVNVEQGVDRCREAARAGADWIQLPEMFAFHGPYRQLWDAADDFQGELFSTFARLAAELKVVLFAGSWPERVSGDSTKVLNVSYVFSRDGSILGRYEKAHLFNLYGQDGRKLYCESDGYRAGNDLIKITVEGWKVGLSTCYDLRFPGFYQRLWEKSPEGMDLFSCPSAFTLETGQAHWQLLLQARAVELQAYAFAANQCGEHRPGKRSFGHGMIIDPWGEKLADVGDTPGIAQARIEFERLHEVRTKLPALKNRRPELYR